MLMNKLTFLFLALFCSLAFSSFASAQAAGGGRVAVINTEEFSNPKTGITKYITAAKSVDTEFAPAIKELDTQATRIQSLEKEITALRQSVAAADQQTAQRKADDYEKLRRDFTFKQEDVKARYGRRYKEATTQLSQSISIAMTEFARKNGYAIILDLARDKEGVIVDVPDEKADITVSFIAFYNSKP